MTIVHPSQTYRAEIEAWQRGRDMELRDPNGWLTLAGLFWLSPGRNTFGSDAGNDIVFPAQKAAPRLGTFVLDGDKVTVEIAPGVDVRHEDESVARIVMKDDMSGEPTILRHRSLSWLILRRGDQIGVRLRDGESPALTRFTGVPTFPTDPAWRLEAVLEPYNPPKTILIPTVLGTINPTPSPGALCFEVDGEPYRLDAQATAGGGFSLIFADATSGVETYSGGRFLRVNPVDATGRTIIDFNRAYNPPCIFTPYATCPRPPQQNRLPIPIRAGERTYPFADAGL
jgi:uncharacterized protein